MPWKIRNAQRQNCQLTQNQVNTLSKDLITNLGLDFSFADWSVESSDESSLLWLAYLVILLFPNFLTYQIAKRPKSKLWTKLKVSIRTLLRILIFILTDSDYCLNQLNCWKLHKKSTWSFLRKTIKNNAVELTYLSPSYFTALQHTNYIHIYLYQVKISRDNKNHRFFIKDFNFPLYLID